MDGMAKPLAALIVAGVVALAAAAAGAFDLTQKIPGGNQTACLDVAGSKTADGTPIIAYPCNGGSAQNWSLGQGGLINSRAFLCLDSQGKYGNTQLVLNKCSIEPSQTWSLR